MKNVDNYKLGSNYNFIIVPILFIVIIIALLLPSSCCNPKNTLNEKFKKGDIIYIMPDSTLGVIERLLIDNRCLILYKSKIGVYERVIINRNLVIKK